MREKRGAQHVALRVTAIAAARAARAARVTRRAVTPRARFNVSTKLSFGALGGISSTAVAINDVGVIAGGSKRRDGHTHAVL